MIEMLLSIEEIVETLKRTHLPTVLTEGRDDYTVFRFIEDEFDGLQVSVMPVGGKSVLQKLFERRDEFHIKPLFIMDQDTWTLFGIPTQYENSDEIVFTSGFSIENDMYIDGNLIKLLSHAERIKFDQEVDEICRWFACMIARIEGGQVATLKTNPHRILGGADRKMSREFKLSIDYRDPDDALYAKIRSNYETLLRGKTLLLLLAQHLSKPKRRPKHSFAALLEYGSIARGPRLCRILDYIKDFFNIEMPRRV